MVMLDTNMILRYLLNDNEEMAEKAEYYVNSGNVFVTVEVIAEVVYVLKGVYSMERETIAKTIKAFLELVYCWKLSVLKLALDTYAEQNIDFVDCVLYSYYVIEEIEVATFDKKLKRLIHTIPIRNSGGSD